MELLTINKTDYKSDEDKGPSVDADNREERIQARRLRIKKKEEINRKKQRGISTPVEKDVKKEMSKSRKQIDDSRTRLIKLEKDGLELVTNIRVAGDAREHYRRNEEEEAFRLRKERLEQESKAASEKFEEIIKKWETAQTKDIPQELHEMLMDQKQLCDSMIDEKNKLINDFEMDLKQKDDLYVKTLKKNAEDIDLLIERMKEQIRNMRRFFYEEMVNVENTFINERKELLDKFRNEWEERMNERREKEVKFLDARFKRVETNEQELHEIRVRDAEEYNEKKVKLETDVQILEQQLQQMKATYQLNQEKLEYNYRVLQKRDDENAITKAQQKRKITKLQDLRTNLKNKLAKQIVEFNDENQQLSNEYKRVTDMFTDLQHKSKHFLTVDSNKFHDIWIMNEEKCKELASSLLNADKIIHEQQLGIKWSPNDISFLNNVGPINLKSKMKSGKEFANELLAEQDEEEEEEEDEEEDEEIDYYEDNEDAKSFSKTETSLKRELTKIRNENRDVVLNLSKGTLRKILMLISDESEFLVEQKLSSLLQPLEKNEQSMIKVDSIFKALNIETENDVKLLAQYFINYNHYNELIKHNSFILKKHKKIPQYKESGVGPSNESSRSDFDKLTQSVNNLNINNTDDDANSQNDLKELKVVPSDKCDLINSNEVLNAMKTFVSIHKKIQKQDKISKFRLNNLDDRDTSGDREYWDQYTHLIDEKKEKLWDSVLFALQKYYNVLNKRSQLIDENDALKLQNKELRILLTQYMQSPVNQELEIPPTKILQMEYSQ